MDRYAAAGLDWHEGAGLARADGGGRAVRIGDDLAKINFFMKNAVLGHFWPFLDVLDVRNESGSKFRVYGYVVSGGLYDENKSISCQIYDLQ